MVGEELEEGRMWSGIEKVLEVVQHTYSTICDEEGRNKGVRAEIKDVSTHQVTIFFCEGNLVFEARDKKA